MAGDGQRRAILQVSSRWIALTEIEGDRGIDASGNRWHTLRDGGVDGIVSVVSLVPGSTTGLCEAFGFRLPHSTHTRSTARLLGISEPDGSGHLGKFSLAVKVIGSHALVGAGLLALPVKSVFHKFLIICCALYLSGTHWMVLQVTAWTGMIAARSQVAPVSEAIGTTLDGQHPCRLCDVIDAGQKTEKKNEKQVPTVKKLVEAKFLDEASVDLPPRYSSHEMDWPARAAFPRESVSYPLTPPPRGAGTVATA